MTDKSLSTKLDKVITVRVREEDFDTYQSNPVLAATARSIFRQIVSGEIVIEPDGETFTGVENAHPERAYIASLENETEHLKHIIRGLLLSYKAFELVADQRKATIDGLFEVLRSYGHDIEGHETTDGLTNGTPNHDYDGMEKTLTTLAEEIGIAFTPPNATEYTEQK